MLTETIIKQHLMPAISALNHVMTMYSALMVFRRSLDDHDIELIKSLFLTKDIVQRVNVITEYYRYPNGMRHGPCTESYRGRLISECIYVDGLIEGECIKYHNTGELKCIERYVGGWLNGETTYYEDNSVAAKINYVNGVRQGLYEGYLDGHVRYRGYYVDNCLEGLYYHLSSDGRIVKQYSYLSGEKSGFHYGYDADFNIIQMKHYCEGLLDGTCLKYHSNGRVKEVKTYVDGHLVNQVKLNERGYVIE